MKYPGSMRRAAKRLDKYGTISSSRAKQIREEKAAYNRMAREQNSIRSDYSGQYYGGVSQASPPKDSQDDDTSEYCVLASGIGVFFAGLHLLEVNANKENNILFASSILAICVVSLILSIKKEFFPNKASKSISITLNELHLPTPVIEEFEKKVTVTVPNILREDTTSLHSPESITVENQPTSELVELRSEDVQQSTSIQESVALKSPPIDMNILTEEFFSAVIQNDVEKVASLIERGVDVNALTTGGITALMLAAKNSTLPILRLLIKRGADVNAVSNNGSCAISIAAQSGNFRVVTKLIEAGADVNALSHKSGKTILMLLISSGLNDIDKLNMVIGWGADVNAVDKENKSVLRYAIASSKANFINSLLDAGAQLSQEDVDSCDDVAILQLLEDKLNLNLETDTTECLIDNMSDTKTLSPELEKRLREGVAAYNAINPDKPQVDPEAYLASVRGENVPMEKRVLPKSEEGT